VRRDRSLSTHQARSAHHAGQRRTRHVTASLRSGSASHLRSCQPRAHAPPSVQDAPLLIASAQLVLAGLARALPRLVTTLANASPSWVSARMARSQSTHLERSAQHAGQQRTLPACALLLSAFAMQTSSSSCELESQKVAALSHLWAATAACRKSACWNGSSFCRFDSRLCAF